MFKGIGMRIGSIVLAGILCCTVCPSWGEEISTTYEHTLDNGLKIVVREDHRAPLVVTELWFKVGGSYEYDGLTGISHALEHMMFKGTPLYPPGQFSKIIAENGGQQNAATSYDYTFYFQEIEVDKLALCFELEADRMQNLNLAQDEFARELKVVMEERRLRVEDNEEAHTRERFYAAAYINNPRRHPVIGWSSDIQNLTLQDLKSWYKTWYGPNNATLVVVGNVKPAEVFALAQKYFAALPRLALPSKKPLREEPPLGERRVTVELSSKVPYLVMGYNAPALFTAEKSYEPYALTVLMMILDGGQSARFSERLIRGKGIAANTQIGYDPFQLNSTLLVFSGSPAEGHSIKELEEGFIAEIERLKKEPITEEELKRAQAMVIAEHIFKRDSMLGVSHEIGKLESIGASWRLMDSFVTNIQAVTGAQIQELAAKYLTSERLTVTRLIPAERGA